MANKYTRRKRKKLHLWKQEPWQYFVIIPLSPMDYFFDGTVWAWNRREARTKFNRRCSGCPEARFVGPQLLCSYMRKGMIINADDPKIIRHPKIVKELKDWREE